MKNNNMNEAINISNDTYGGEMYTNVSGSMPGFGVQSHNSGIDSSYVLQKYAEMEKQKEESEAKEKRAKMKKALGTIGLFIFAAVLSVLAVWIMQPMDLATSIVCGVVMFYVLVMKIVQIKDNQY